MTSVLFAVLAVLLAVSIDAKDPECPDPSYDGQAVFIPDYYDCSWYYECSDGVKVHMECPATLFWDDDLNTCNFPENTDCAHTYPPTGVPTATASSAAPTAPTAPSTARPTVSPTAPTGPTGPTARPTVTPTAAPTARPTDAPLGKLCVGKIDGEILPYPNDCSRYVQCVKSEEFYYKCPRDTYFDRVTAACSSSSPDRC